MTERNTISTPALPGGLPYDATQIGFSQATLGSANSVAAKLQQIVSVKDAPYNAVGDGVTDDYSATQAFLNRGGKLIMGGGGTYKISSGNLNFVANTELWIETGTTLLLSGTRIFMQVNDAHIRGGGKISSVSLNTTDSIPTNWEGLGIVNMGNTVASPALRVSVEGVEVQGDFVGTPGTIAIAAGDKRRGIYINHCQTARVSDCNIHGTIGEAVLYNGQTPTNDLDINVIDNDIHDYNHDGISHVGTAITSFRSRGNTLWNGLNGIEISAGDHQRNEMFSMIGSGFGFGGNSASDSVSPVIVSNNTGVNNGTNDFDLEGATSAGGVVLCQNNSSHGAGGFAFVVSFAKTAIVTGNKANGWGVSATGSGLSISNCTNYICDGNILSNENVAHSNGGFNISGAGIWGGGNVTLNVALPFVSAFGIQTLGQIIRTSIPTTVTGATYTVLATDSDIIANRAGTVTLTLESAPNIPGKRLVVRTIQAQTVVSNASNVVPLVGGAAGTAILAATAGKYAELKSDGVNWTIMQAN